MAILQKGFLVVLFLVVKIKVRASVYMLDRHIVYECFWRPEKANRLVYENLVVRPLKQQCPD